MTNKKPLKNSTFDNSFGEQSVSAQQREQKIRRVFKLVAQRYDLMNDVMSFGTHRFWKKYFVNQISFKTDDLIVDLAGGTGDIARQLANKGANVLLVDSSIEMIQAGKKKTDSFKYIVAIGEYLPFADDSIDSLSISFGLRNMTRMSDALTEIHRVLKPGGKFYCLEFSHVKMPLRPFYQLHNKYIIPHLGAWISGQQEAYQYLVDSIKHFPNQEAMKQLIKSSGFSEISYENIFLGIACIHYATKNSRHF